MHKAIPPKQMLEKTKQEGKIMITAVTIFAYVTSIVAVNLGFDSLPILDTPLGTLPTMAFFVGLVFIFRDFVQRRVGHLKVLPWMLVGVVITWLTVSPELAMASVAAFAISELVDWAVYTYTKRTFENRVLLSSAISTPMDSAVFLALIGFFSIGSVIIMAASKMLVAVLMWHIWRATDAETKLGHKLGKG